MTTPTDIYRMKLTTAQAAGYLVMVIFCVFPPAVLLMSGIGFGPSPLLTILLASALGGGTTAVLMNWPNAKFLAAVCGLIGGVGAQVALFACVSWWGDGRVPNVVLGVAMAAGVVPGYLVFRWLRRGRAGVGTQTT